MLALKVCTSMLNSTFLFMFFMTVSLPEPRVHWFGKNSCPAKLRDPSVSTAHQHKTSKVPSFFCGVGVQTQATVKALYWLSHLPDSLFLWVFGRFCFSWIWQNKQTKQTNKQLCMPSLHLIIAAGGDWISFDRRCGWGLVPHDAVLPFLLPGTLAFC